MDLWQGSLSQFVRQAESGSLSGDMTGQFVKHHRYPPGSSEVRSWEHSLAALASALRPLRRADMGVAIGATGAAEPATIARDASSPPGVALEYHLPLSGRRVDVMITGHDAGGQASAVVLELKQWSVARLEDEFATNLWVGEHEHVHPSEQARDYAEWLTDYHSGFTSGALAAVPAAYCHEMRPPLDATLRDAQHRRERAEGTAPSSKAGSERRSSARARISDVRRRRLPTALWGRGASCQGRTRAAAWAWQH